ncbi:hypothetical protein, partial [Microcoleus sp. D2_18a_D3]|uniref:hypothetical protein n=1 Tax=Microcoleus sp. D2_18a_D3 TaxID=3055330 RepID=UPI002FD0C9E0
RPSKKDGRDAHPTILWKLFNSHSLVTSLCTESTGAYGALMSGLGAAGAPYHRWRLKEFVGPTPIYSGSQAL